MANRLGWGSPYLGPPTTPPSLSRTASPADNSASLQSPLNTLSNSLISSKEMVSFSHTFFFFFNLNNGRDILGTAEGIWVWGM